MKFSKKEIYDLLKAWVVVTAVFAIAARNTAPWQELILMAAIGVGIGFLLHELAHKFTAEYYGLQAEFKGFDKFLLVSLLLSVAGLILLAPGAVVIHRADKLRMGRIAAAGPLTNIVLSLLFFGLFYLFPHNIFSFGAYVNAFLALFNMMPVFVLDGKKVLAWNKQVFWTLLISAGLLVLLTAQ
tara:strand:- start:293 stop:844 length:552 start_codon:yes stop_codon:yes gene_type:complete